MISFCTRCWAENDAQTDLCPHCGSRQNADSRSYEEKLVAALAHPLPQARARICWLIGENNIRGAVPRLMDLAEHDPDLFVQNAAIRALGTMRDSRSDPLLQRISVSANRFLAETASESLKGVRRPHAHCQ